MSHGKIHVNKKLKRQSHYVLFDLQIEQYKAKRSNKDNAQLKLFVWSNTLYYLLLFRLEKQFNKNAAMFNMFTKNLMISLFSILNSIIDLMGFSH